MNTLDRRIEDGGHQFVHVLGVVAFDVVRFPSAAAQELVELLGFDAGQHGRVADLVAVQMQDRQHRPIADRIQELVECQAVASGPVSASPSPMTQATIRSGLSNTAPNAWLSE